MTDREALLASVLANPAEDLPRTVFADYLDETAATMGCQNGCRVPVGSKKGYQVYENCGPESRWARCEVCRGKGRVSDGRAEWAELIRVQVEYARDFDPYERAPRGESMRKRMGELWKVVGESFDIRMPGLTLESRLPWESGASVEPNVCVVSRGFVSAIDCRLAPFLEHARELFAAHPIEAVTLTDRVPSEDERGLFYWYSGSGDVTPYHAPSRLPDLIRERLVYGVPGSILPTYPTPEAAMSALSAACVRRGRSLADLPEPAPVV